MKFIFRSFQVSLILLLVYPTSGFSQKQWSLQECVDYAVQHNLSVKQQYIATISQENSVNQSLYSFFPTLNASGSGSFNWGRSVDPFSYTFTNAEIKSINPSLSSNVTIFNGFQLQNTLKQSKLNFMAGQNDLKKIQNDISLSVVSAYLQFLYAKEQFKLTQSRVNESQKQRVGQGEWHLLAGGGLRSDGTRVRFGHDGLHGEGEEGWNSRQHARQLT